MKHITAIKSLFYLTGVSSSSSYCPCHQGMGVSCVSSPSKSDAADSKAFRINLFPDTGAFMKNEGGGSSKGGDSDNSNFIMIDIDGTADSKTFERYLQDLDLKDDGDKAGAKESIDEEDDLLSLMDSCK